MCLISFIVPVYNLETEVVDQCVNSLLNQTLTNNEIIIVDDGSNNGIQDFCDELGKKNNIQVVHQPNSGLAVARNTGMIAAKGEWIIHVDGDDWIDEYLAESVYNACQGRDVDIIVWGFYRSLGEIKQELLLKNKNIFDNSFESIREKTICSILGNDTSFESIALNTSWGKAYNSKFIKHKNLFYDARLRRAQDAVYNLYAFNYALNVIYVDKALNYYRVDNVSLSRGYNPKTLEYLTQTALAAKEFATQSSVPNVRTSSDLFVRRCFRMINEQYIQHSDNPDSTREKKKIFKETIDTEPFRSAFNAPIKSPKLSIRITDYLIMHGCYYSVFVFCRFVKFLSKEKTILVSRLR